MQLIPLTISLLLLIGCATTSAQETSNQETSDQEASNQETSEQEEAPLTQSGERLMATPPSGWQRIYQFNNQKLRISEFIPAEEKGKAWTIKLAFESNKAEAIEIDPLDLLQVDTDYARKNCRETQLFNVYAGYENEYETAVQMLICTENISQQMGEIALIKAIRGNEYYYVIRLVRRVPPFKPGEHNLEEKEIALWSRYLSQMYVCDDSEKHPCDVPSGN